MTIDQIIALSASVGAFMSATAAFLAVRQNMKQRQESYRPEIAIKSIGFEGTVNPLLGGALPTYWINQENKGKELNYIDSLSVPMRNVGLGAAKEININWSFSIEDLVTKINDLAQRSLIPAFFEYKNEVLSLNSETLGTGISNWSNQKNTAIDYILPAPVDDTPTTLYLPQAFKLLISALIYLSFNFNNKNDEKHSKIPNLPNLKLDLEYFDIGGVKHKATFDISITIMSVTGNVESFQGLLKSTKHT
jgi:hypothetical protein